MGLAAVWRNSKPFLLLILSLLGFLRAVNVGPSEAGKFYEFLKLHLYTDRPVFFVLACVLLYFAIRSFRYRNKPLTIVSSEITLKYQDDRGDEIHLTKTQEIRANQPDVTAFYSPVHCSSGSIPRDKIICRLSGTGYKPTVDWDPRGCERSREIVHTFEPPIPRYWWKSYTVTREEEVTFHKPWNPNEEYFEIDPRFYPTKWLEIAIVFHESRPPKPDSCKAYRIVAHAAIPVTIVCKQEETGNNMICRLAVSPQRNARYRIIWDF